MGQAGASPGTAPAQAPLLAHPLAECGDVGDVVTPVPAVEPREQVQAHEIPARVPESPLKFSP